MVMWKRLKCLIFGHQPEQFSTISTSLAGQATLIRPVPYYVIWVVTPRDEQMNRKGRGLNFCERCGELVVVRKP